MPEVTRRIGLSLGADICWPQCYEDLVRRLDPRVPIGDDTVRFEVERITIEPFENSWWSLEFILRHLLVFIRIFAAKDLGKGRTGGSLAEPGADAVLN